MSFVIDNAVLSSFYNAGWYQSLESYPPERELLVPKRIWDEEFLPEHDVRSPPEWLIVRRAEQLSYPEPPGRLSEQDLCCLALADERESSIVTNDKTLIEVAKARGVDTKWGTRFVIETFERCGISQDEFDEGVTEYGEDVWLPEHVFEKLTEAEKP